MTFSYQVILDFWFSKEKDEAKLIQRQSSLWWGKDKIVDKQIESQFSPVYWGIKQRQLEAWKENPRSLLAMIIVIDQFSRQIYRDRPEAFQMDTLALELCLQGIEKKMDRQLKNIERVFFYMPMEHSESLSIQKQCVKKFQELLEEVDDSLKSSFQGYLSFAQKHFEIIERFGRFPHRNIILGRSSSPEEEAFLKQAGSSF